MDLDALFRDIEEHPSREFWENRIDERANAIPLTSGPDWINSEEFSLFIDAWFSLSKFYERYTDTVIGVDAFSAYVDFTRLLRVLITDNTVDLAIREAAQERIGELEGVMSEVIKEAGTNFNQSLGR